MACERDGFAWLELRVRCRPEAVDAVADALADVTGCGVAIDDPSLPARARREGRWDLDDLPGPPGGGHGVAVIGYLSAARGGEDAIARLRERLAAVAAAGLGRPALVGQRPVAEADWADNWKRYFKPLRAGRSVVVVPSWERFDPRPDDVVLRLDPGMAFGTGTHPTTRMCLEALEDELSAAAPQGRGDRAPTARGAARAACRVLDVGCGSGILSIAALRLGAAEAVAIDTDPLAVDVARANAALNGVGERLELFCGPLEAWLRRFGPVDAAGARPASAPPPPGHAAGRQRAAFDVVVANIVADAIIALASRVGPLLSADGRFIAGGIIEPRAAGVTAALQRAGFTEIIRRDAEGWITFLARSPKAAGRLDRRSTS